MEPRTPSSGETRVAPLMIVEPRDCGAPDALVRGNSCGAPVARSCSAVCDRWEMEACGRSTPAREKNNSVTGTLTQLRFHDAGKPHPDSRSSLREGHVHIHLLARRKAQRRNGRLCTVI